MATLNLKPGTWLLSDCGKMPSESNCQLVMMVPASEKAHLIEAGIDHMVKKHGHEEAAARKMMVEEGDSMFETVTI
ncbi:MAG: hypothetical protein HY372_03450 [Candidatus Andersenbacteria bacterium]|nr:hypothetical protein [Candidatus Andersenbacteria bacterium]